MFVKKLIFIFSVIKLHTVKMASPSSRPEYHEMTQAERLKKKAADAPFVPLGMLPVVGFVCSKIFDNQFSILVESSDRK